MKKVLSVFFAVLFVFMFIVPAFAAQRFFPYGNGTYVDTETGILYTDSGRGPGSPIIDENGEPETVSAEEMAEMPEYTKEYNRNATILLIAIIIVIIILSLVLFGIFPHL